MPSPRSNGVDHSSGSNPVGTLVPSNIVDPLLGTPDCLIDISGVRQPPSKKTKFLEVPKPFIPSEKQVLKDIERISKRLQQKVSSRAQQDASNEIADFRYFMRTGQLERNFRRRKLTAEKDYEFFKNMIEDTVFDIQESSPDSDLSAFAQEYFEPQAGFEVNHNIRWEAGDRIVNGITNYFSSAPRPIDPNDVGSEYFSINNEQIYPDPGHYGPNEPWYTKIFNFVSDDLSLKGFVLVTLFTFMYRRSKLSKYFLYLSLSLLALKEFAKLSIEKTPLVIEIISIWETLDADIEKTADHADIEMDTVDPQSMSDAQFKGISSLSTVLITSIIGYKARGNISEALLQATRTSETQTSNVTVALLWVSKTLHEFFSETLNQDNIAQYFYVESVVDVEVSEHLDKVSRFIALVNAGNPYGFAYVVEVYETYMTEGKALMRKVDKFSYDLKCLTTSCNKLNTLKQEMENMRASLTGERVEPVGVLVKGTPGCFKSVLCSRLGNVLAKHTIPAEWRDEYNSNPKDFHYSKPSDRFFDGYTNKAWVTYIDDFNQKRDVAGAEDSEALNVIKMINTAPYPLPMAKVESKNNVFFRSPFVIANTNMQNWNTIQSVHSSEAVRRRFNVELDVCINRKYTKEDGITLDPFTLPIINLVEESDLLAECTDIPNDFWDINATIKTANDSYSRKGLTLVDVLELTIEKHHDRIKHFYVNRSSYSRLSNTLSDELDNRLAKADKYSELARKTFSPQSGIPKYTNNYEDDSDRSSIYTIGSSQAEACYKQQISVPEQFHNLSYKDQGVVEIEFFTICSSLRRLDIANKGFKYCFATYFDRLDLKQRVLMNSTFSRNRQQFFYTLHREWKQLLDSKINPVTGSIEWFSTDSRDKIKDILRTCKNAFGKLIKWISDHSTQLLIGIPVFTGISYLLVQLFRKILRSSDMMGPQSVDFSRAGKRVGVRKGSEMRLSKNAVLKLSPQGFNLKPVDFSRLPKIIAEDFGDKNNRTNVMATIFNRYMFIVYVVDNSEDHSVRRLGHCINIQGPIFGMPFHFIYSLIQHSNKPDYQGAHVVLSTPTQSIRYHITLEEFVEDFRTTESASDNDFCLVKVKSAQLSSIGALRYFLTNRDVEKLMTTTSFNAVISGTCQRRIDSPILNLRTSHTSAKLRKDPIPVRSNWDEENPYYSLSNVLEYKSSFSGGDCGTLLITQEAVYESRIIVGMHVAGDSTNGFSTLVTQESLQELMNEVSYADSICFVDEEEPKFVTSEVDFEAQHSMVPVASLAPAFIPGEVVCSDITKSRFHSRLLYPYNKVGTAPAKLRPFVNSDGVFIDPGMNALMKYNTYPVTIPSLVVEKAVESYEQLIIEHTRISRENRIVIPMETALHAFGKVNPIASNTSAGFPMNISTQENLKKLYFDALKYGREDVAAGVLERLASIVEDHLRMYRKGIRPFFLYKDTLKDEKVKYEKMIIGKTRLFSGGPFILLILFRMYFGAYMDMFTDANINIGSAIGVNPYSVQWDSLARNMLRFCDTHSEEAFIFGDYSGFDTSIMVILMNAVLGIITRWYGNTTEQQISDNKIRTLLWMEISNSRHVFRGKVYEWQGRNPSGCAVTALLNTMVNNILFRMAWQFADIPIDEFNTHAVIIALGDDNGCGVHKKYRKVFNENTMPYLMHLCGMKYTDETKKIGVKLKVLRSITECSFLKRSFVYDKSLGRWIAPIEMASITEMLNWTSKGRAGDQIAVDNILNALSEMSLHGPILFNSWRDHLLDLKDRYYEEISPHGTIPSTYESAFRSTLNIEYYY